MDYMVLVDSYINSSFYEPDELQHVSMVSHLSEPFGSYISSQEKMCHTDNHTLFHVGLSLAKAYVRSKNKLGHKTVSGTSQ